MKLLYNETYGEDIRVEFFWYNSEIKDLSKLEIMVEDILNYVKTETRIETQYYFYTNIVNKDAIGDDVRTTIMIRKNLDKSFDVNFNISDTQMALHMDTILKCKNKLIDSL